MNQFFSHKRFTLLVWKHWADNKKRYLLTITAFIGLLIAGGTFGILIPENKACLPTDLQLGVFLFSLFVTGTFYASQYFSHLGSTAKASNFLLVPASTFEKFLCSLFYTALLFLLVFMAAFYLADILLVRLANTIAANNQLAEKSEVLDVFAVGIFRFNNRSTLSFLPIFISLQSAFLLGSVFFKKYAFIKTIIGCFIAWLTVFTVVYILRRLLLPDVEDLVEIPDWVAHFLSILAYITAPVLWTLTYHRLKRKQV
jgi:hypothetical protein